MVIVYTYLPRSEAATIQEVEYFVKTPPKVSALGNVTTKGDGSRVGAGGSLGLVRPTQQIGRRGVIGIKALRLYLVGAWIAKGERQVQNGNPFQDFS